MGEIDAIAQALGARVAPATAGVILTCPRDGRWYTMTARERPHLELAMTVPELAGLALRAQLGTETLLGAEGPASGSALDPRWHLRARDPVAVARVLGEPPWPAGDGPAGDPGPGGGARFLAALVGWLTHGLVVLDGGAGTTPTPRWVLEVADGVATLERRSAEVDPALAVGAARRLLQLVARVVRLRIDDEAAAAAGQPRPGRGRGPYR